MQGKEKNGEGAQERKGAQGRDKARERKKERKGIYLKLIVSLRIYIFC